MASGYSEDSLVEQPAIALLGELGWETYNAYYEFEQGTSPLGRETKAEVVIGSRLQAALEKLNPDAPAEARAREWLSALIKRRQCACMIR